MVVDQGTHVYDVNLDADSDLQTFFESDSLVIATRFFRNPKMYRDLENILIPTLLKESARETRKMRLWSAGCSDGREAYSLAMTVNRALRQKRDLQIDWQVRGSDLNRPQISKARAGVYTATEHDQAFVQGYGEFFDEVGANTLQVNAAIKDRVTFEVEDIIQYNPPEPLDVLVCSLVVLYYQPDYQKEIINALISHVRPGGYFHIAPVNRRWLVRQGHTRVSGESGAFFCRSSGAA